MAENIRTRIAPSPTGNLHVGTARAALYNELFARKHGGEFIVRIEDTDKERSKPEFEANILEGLQWLGLRWNEGPDVGGSFGPYRQSERVDAHKEAIATLLEKDAVYEVEGGALKMRVPDEEVTYTDLIRGEVTMHPDTWGGDFVVARSATDPVFHLALVIDDAAMEISHVIRGEDHVSNTPRHVLIQRALDLPTPIYAHLPLLLNDERKKLSKRANEVNLLAFRDQGFLPDAMRNYLALLGWNPGDDREIFSHEELIETFSLERVQKGGAIFSLDKLKSMNQHYLRELSPSELLESARTALESAGYDLSDTEYWEKAVKTEQERVSTASELSDALEYFKAEWAGDYEPALLIWRKSDEETTRQLLEKTLAFLEELSDNEFTAETLEEKLISWIDESNLGRGDTLWPLRVALTGRDKSPSPFEVAEVLGKPTSLERIQSAIDKLA